MAFCYYAEVKRDDNGELFIERTVNPELAPVVHAYWKLTANKNHNICAYCGTFAPLWFDDDGEKIEWLSDYCPHCGAKMDEKEEG